MGTSLCGVLGLALCVALPNRGDDAAAARDIVDKAIQAMGGETALSKYKALTANVKGVLQTQEMSVPFTGALATQGADQEKFKLDLDFNGQLLTVVEVLNRDRGWVKIGEETTDMDSAKLSEAIEEAHAGWVAMLTPLKDKAFTLASVGEAEVAGKPAFGVRASHTSHRDVILFFDKANHLLVKSETRVKDEESGREVTEETFLGAYDGKDVQSALKITVKRDGKPYLDAELSEVRLEERLDDSVFGKP